MTESQQVAPFIWWRNRSYLLLSSIMFMSFFAGGLARPLFSIRAQNLGAALWQIGMIGTVSQIAGAAVQYIWGQQSDKVMRRKPLVLVGMGGSALSMILVGVVSSYKPLYPIQALASFTSAAYTVGSLAMIGDVLEGWPNRGRLMGIHRGGGSLAFGLAALFGGKLADLYGTAMPFLVGGLFEVVAFLLACWLPESPARELEPGLRTPLAVETGINLAKIGRILPFLLVTFFWAFSMSSAFAFWPVYMVEQGFTKTVITRLWGLAALGESAAMILAGHLCDRYGSKNIVAAGLAGMGLIFVAYTIWSRLPWLILIQLCRSLAFSCYSAASMIYAVEMGLRRQRGRMAGLHSTASSLGGISGAAIGGGLAEAIGLGPMIRSTGLLMVLGGLVGGWKMTDPEIIAATSRKADVTAKGIV